jgi:Tol biopolymer transport system component
MRRPRPTIAVALTLLALLSVLAAGGGQATGSAFPGANGRIAYASNEGGSWDVYSMNPDGSGKRQLTADPGDDTQPSYSPDGSRIAFASNRGGNFDIYAMNSDGSGVVRLTTDPGVETQPSFSPDGSRIAFIAKRGASWYGDVYTMNADGSDQVRLTSQGGIEDGPTYSPDGQRIAFGRTEGGRKHIFTMNTAGGELAALTHGASDDRRPSFSPDGSRIAFDSRGAGSFQIYAMSADGSGVVKLTGKATASQRPAYSPDGSRIAFDRGGSIFTMRAGGGGEVQLTSGRGAQAWASWQPLLGPLAPGPKHGKGGAGDRLRIGKPILDRRRGTAKLPVTVPAAGTLRLRGRGVKPLARRSVAGPRTVKLLVKPKARVARVLAQKARAKVKVLVTYDRKNGGKETGAKSFSLRKKRG